MPWSRLEKHLYYTFEGYLVPTFWSYSRTTIRFVFQATKKPPPGLPHSRTSTNSSGIQYISVAAAEGVGWGGGLSGVGFGPSESIHPRILTQPAVESSSAPIRPISGRLLFQDNARHFTRQHRPLNRDRHL